MVKPNVTKRAGVGKPVSQFKAPKRPEITRLPPYDDADGSLTTTGKVLGKGSGKDGRPIVADLIRLRENETKLVQELANEKARAQEAGFAERLERKPTFPKRKLSPLLMIEYGQNGLFRQQ